MIVSKRGIILTMKIMAHFENEPSRKGLPKTAIAAGAAALAIGAAIALRAIWRRFGPATYARFNTMFGRARVYQVEDDEGSPVRLLEVGGIVQSGTYIDERYDQLVFEYLKRYDLMFEGSRIIRRVCVLGCGGYDYPKHLVAHHPTVHVDAVEVDPAITAIARRYFFLDRLIAEQGLDADCADCSSAPDNGGGKRDRLRLICDDALEHLRNTRCTYDAIVNDCFDAGRPPSHLTGEPFAQLVHARLNPAGIYLVNIVSALEGPHAEFLKQQMTLYSSRFSSVAVIPCDPDNLTEPDNVILVAVKGD